MASAIEMSMSHQSLSATLKHVRNRWRMKVALRGLMAIVGVALLAVFAGSWIMELFRFTPVAVNTVRIVSYLALAGFTVWYCIRPLTRRVDDRQVALYLEENEPSLETAMISAVELGNSKAQASLLSTNLASRIVDMAVTRSEAIDGGAHVEKSSVKLSLLVIAGVLAAGTLLLSFGPDFMRSGARLLATPWVDPASASPYMINVHPGDATVARGGDQTIRIQLKGFHSEEADLAIQRQVNGAWERLPMSATQEPDVFEIRLLDIDEQLTYYVESNDVRSPRFSLNVIERPSVRSLSLEYRYPVHTGMATEWIEDGGDIAAPRGTSVIIRAKTTLPVTGGKIMVEGQPPVAMTLDNDGTLTGTLNVRDNGFYHVELVTIGGDVPGTIPYTIDALKDLAPTITFLKPGRDLHVNATDDIATQIEATDDYGVATIEIRYSVNGGPEQRTVLHSSRSRLKEVLANHTFSLKNFEFKTGDFISYYAQAVDNDSPRGKTAKSDLYFLHMRAADEKKKGQKNQQSNESEKGLSSLSQQQQEIISNTFRTDRDANELSPEELREQSTVIARSQTQLSERVEKLVQQMKDRGVSKMDTAYKNMSERLAEASKAMRQATQALNNQNLSEAMKQEQRALEQLQKADKIFQDRKKNPVFENSNFKNYETNAKDMANMFDPEEKGEDQNSQKDQEEAQNQTDQSVDDVLEQLKQLTEEQQRENNRQQQSANSPQKSSDGGEKQRQLAQQTEKAAQQLSQAQRQAKNDGALRESERKLEEAAKNMRRMAAGSRDKQQAASTLQQLKDAQRQLEQRQAQRSQEKGKQGQGQQGKEGQQQQGQEGKEGKEGQQGQQGQQGQKGEGGKGQEGKGEGEGEEKENMDRARDAVRKAQRTGSGKPDLDAQTKQREELEDLRDKMKRDGKETAELDKAIEQMKDLEKAIETNEDPETAKILQASIIDGLKNWELGLRRQSAAKGTVRPLSGGTNDVPDGFKSLVAEYYRSLAKKRQVPAKK